MAGIRVRGLAEFRRSVRRISPELDKALTKELKAAGKVVSDSARSGAPIGPAANGHIKSSIRPFAKRKAAGVRMGGARYPYVFWLEYGGRVGRNKSVHRGRSKSGHIVGAAYRRNRVRVFRGIASALPRAVRAAGLGGR